MASISHGPEVHTRERPDWLVALDSVELWAGLAIVVMWLAVLFDGVWGPDIVSNGGANSSGGVTTVPSVVVVALFAFLGTGAVAKYAFRRDN